MTDNDIDNETETESEQAAATSAEAGPQFVIHKIYVKDVSFETPSSPDVFRAEWRPDIDLQINNDARAIGDDVYEVVVRVTATAKLGDKTAFLAEVVQGGIFGISGLNDQEMGPMVGSFCPNILFPYVREAISDLVIRGGFPPLVLSPVNFDALYTQQLQEKQAQAQAQAQAPEEQAESLPH